ncbi:hypothetical protein B4Q13_24940, partial [Lacticaseibacillus rhamnosus]
MRAPIAARAFQPGQFYRLQNYESLAAHTDSTSLAMEGLALTGASVDLAKGLLSTIVLIFVTGYLYVKIPKGFFPDQDTGFLFGATAMFRPEYTLVAAAFVVFAAARWAWQREWAFGATAIGLMLLALLLPIVPWTIRNIVVLDRLVPISTGGGKALYVGTFYPADGEYAR